MHYCLVSPLRDPVSWTSAAEVTNGALTENIAIKAAAVRLQTPNNCVQNALSTTQDATFQDLCLRVAKTSSELIGVLEKLKVQGTKTGWKSMRKAIKNRLRTELNIHINESARQQLEDLRKKLTSGFDNFDVRTGEILTAVIDGRDLFRSTLDDQTQQISITHHTGTSQEIHQEGDRIVASCLASNGGVTQSVQTVEANLQQTARVNSNSNSQIAELKQVVQQLQEQIIARPEEFRTLIEAYRTATNNRQRNNLRELSNAVATEIVALETMYQSRKDLIEPVQSGVVKVFAKARKTDIWRFSKYRTSATASNEDISLITRMDATQFRRPNPFYDVHEVYYSYYYTWMRRRNAIVNVRDMNLLWAANRNSCLFQSPHKPIAKALVSIHLTVLVSVTLISKVFDEVNQVGKGTPAHRFETSRTRLEADLGYWMAFANLRGMLDDRWPISSNVINWNSDYTACVQLAKHERPRYDDLRGNYFEELHHLLHLLIGDEKILGGRSHISLKPDRPAAHIILIMLSMGIGLFASLRPSDDHLVVWLPALNKDARDQLPLIDT
ncbi:hypothetical protein BU23DRAFT_595985 [Bimuria novae-zelandiae CBS 107.79]|uniref:Uncharacterized protein n=1 Tax=Bimuria novae-zelandiae CBS 107.79 TaxID=1447943 RepID=A0A6A5VLQ1_9PLEO|nr:hypothetical protein BU23DRAFT_595985 [Bimuria novae-zelandiae CBS 107.79]